MATPAIHDGAALLTQGATAWDTGNLTLGGAGEPGAEATWQNSGTLVIAGAPQLLAGSGNGVLRNTSAGTLRRDTPAGAMVAAARIENAGTVHVLAGTMGTPDPLPAPAAEFVQTEGLTTVAAGAGLGMNVTLSGGVLRGAGTVRRIVNSGGTVEPGSSPGTLTIDGDFTQTAGGTLKLEIAGSATGQFDRLIVGEVASLGGTLAIVSAPELRARGADDLPDRPGQGAQRPVRPAHRRPGRRLVVHRPEPDRRHPAVLRLRTAAGLRAERHAERRRRRDGDERAGRHQLRDGLPSAS